MSSDLTKTAQTRRRARPARPGGDFYLDIERRSIGDAVTGYFTRLRSGEPGALPVGPRPHRARRRSSPRSAAAS